MNGSLMPFSSQYFPEAVFLDKIPPCSADTKSGEPLHLAFNLYTFTNMKFFGYFVKNLHMTCMNSRPFQLQLPVKADARMSFIEALKK